VPPGRSSEAPDELTVDRPARRSTYGVLAPPP